MTTFSYIALDPSGKKKTGIIEAKDKEQAIAKVTSEGRFVVEITEKKIVGASDTRKKGKISKSEVALFTRRLADLSGAGLPLDRAIQVVAEQSESGPLAEIAAETLEDVRAGSSVSQALGKHPKVFNEVYSQTLRAGEASGQFS
ncbi:MAG: type II secretion system F family protein, partial [Fimbriimonadaceae bacterium]